MTDSLPNLEERASLPETVTLEENPFLKQKPPFPEEDRKGCLRSVLSLGKYPAFVFAIIAGTLEADKHANLGTYYANIKKQGAKACLLYTSPSPRDLSTSRMPSSA